MNKGWIFIIAAILIALNGYLVFKPNQKVACDVDEDGCDVTGRFNKRMFYISASVLAVGAFFAYALVPILVYFEL